MAAIGAEERQLHAAENIQFLQIFLCEFTLHALENVKLPYIYSFSARETLHTQKMIVVDTKNTIFKKVIFWHFFGPKTRLPP